MGGHQTVQHGQAGEGRQARTQDRRLPPSGGEQETTAAYLRTVLGFCLRRVEVDAAI